MVFLAKYHRTIRAYIALMRLDKPVGIGLLLCPTLWGLWFSAQGVPETRILLTFVVGTVLMRTAGCVINDWADRDIDRQVARTCTRPLATGCISVCAARTLFFVLSLSAFFLVLSLNNLALLAWALLAFVLAATYPLTKRFFAMPQAYLGLAFSFGIPMAYVAQQVPLSAETFWLMLANGFWVLAYDTEYAMVDRADDLKTGIKTAAITLGVLDVPVIMACYVLTLCLLAWVGQQHHLGFFFFVALALAACIAVYHFFLIRQRDPASCFRAFRHNPWFGSVLFVGIALGFWARAQNFSWMP